MTTFNDVLTYTSLFQNCAINNVPYEFNNDYGFCLRAPREASRPLGLRFQNGSCVGYSVLNSYFGELFARHNLEHAIDFDEIPNFIAGVDDIEEESAGVEDLL